MTIMRPIANSVARPVGRSIFGLLPGPSTLTAAIDDTSGGIELTASEVSGADSYSYYYAVDSGAWQSAATGQGTSYTFAPSEAGEYSFAVTAVKGSTESRMTTLVPGSLFDDVSNAEGIALMAFYEATNGDAWTTGTNWLTATTVDTYYGVTVSGGSVTAIDLSSNGLNGDVGTTLDDLTLTSLDLTGNTLTGKILIDPSPATLYLATADGEAMFFPSSGDYSGYAGALGATDHKITFKDSADVEAVGYAAAAGGGETLGGELHTDANAASDSNGNEADATTGWIYSQTTLSSVATSPQAGSYCFYMERVGYAWRDYAPTTDVGKLYKYTAYGKADTNTAAIRFYNGVSYSAISETSGAGWELLSLIQTVRGSGALLKIAPQGETGHAYIDNISLKAYTDIPATGLHLVSAEDGSTRNMASTGTSFDPNNIATIEIEAL